MRFYDELVQDTTVPDYVKEALAGNVVIACDNVSRYFFQESDQEFWDIPDFPNVAPPFQQFWLDFNPPHHITSRERGITRWNLASAPAYWGFQCYGIDLATQEAQKEFISTFKDEEHREYFTWAMSQARWGMDMYLHWKLRDEIYSPLWGWRFLVDEKGVIIKNAEGKSMVSTMSIHSGMKEFIEATALTCGSIQQAQTTAYNYVLAYWHTALLSLSFLHCNNVSLEQITPPIKHVHKKAQKRRGVQSYQPVPYKVLNIQPMREVLRTEGKSEQVGTKRSMEICRGHFKHYENGRGLFGKYKGTFWFPGWNNKESGNKRDYSIKL